MPLPPGTRLGPYELIGPLGSGGMGEVYRARDGRLDREVAVKLLPQDPLRGGAGEQLIREAKTASALNHPNICTIFDVGESEGQVFFAMELLQGTPLDALSIPSGLPVEDVVRYGIQIAAALDHAHRRGIVHCDLKPANVVITETGAKVLDFGIARRGRQLEAEALTRSLEDGRSFSGTPAYMAPEQVRMQPTDERSDVWALGVLLYQAASGRLPFQAATLHDLTSAVLRDPPGPLPAHLPAGLRAVVERCLRKDPEQRYQHASEVRAALEAVAAGTDTASKATTEARVGVDRIAAVTQSAGPVDVRSARRRRLAWAALSLVLLAGVASIVAWKQKTAAQARPPATRTIAILPLRALNQQAADDFLGLGIADAVITKASQLPGLTVRPISAVRAFDKGDVDALEAARRLQVDVVLDGSVQHAGERVKVSVNLLDAHDGSSIWADSFETSAADIFAVQEDIARAVATRLQVRLGPSEQAAIARRYTSSADAYNVFTKGMYHLGNRGWDAQHRLESDTAIALFREALRLDPAFARARAQLAFALMWTAIFIEDNHELIAEASRELAAAGRQDPNLADIHQGRALILWSKYERWRTEAAIRELREAQRLDSSVGNEDLSALYFHCGLDDLAEKFARRSLTLNPDCESCKEGLYGSYLDTIQVEKAAAARKEFWNQPPGAFHYLLKRMPAEAEPLVRKAEQEDAGESSTLIIRALLDAEEGRAPAAEATIRRMLEIVPRNRTYHHAAYNAAQVFSLTGKTREAVSLLKEARDNGLFSYTMLARDRLLDPIRSDPEFASLLAEAKVEWERLKAEFGGS